MSKTIIVSNRLPVKITKKEHEYQLTPSEGGLATGLGSINKGDEYLWIGWPGQEITDEQDIEVITGQLRSLNLLPVFLSQEEINQYYEGFSNEVLWPVFHYYASNYGNYKQSNWDCYRQVNKKFSDAVLSVAQPGDVIWIHDYQLLLTPAMIRAGMPDATIGFFLHIPFPSHEMFRLIPWRSELLEGMLGSDLIGLHTFDYVKHFLSAVNHILPLTSSSSNIITSDHRNIVVEAFAMGIDEKKYSALPLDNKVIEHINLIKDSFKDTQLVLSIDRLDYSKGILQRLQAFEYLLETYPEYAGKITLYMIVVPSRDTVHQYAQLRDQIDKRVGQINSLYRTMDWTPIHYYYRSFPIEELSALYHSANVCLVTPMRDGMNLVSKEYVASRINNDGVLILSELAGSSKELIDALIVNPNNTVEIAQTIIKALNMPRAEQRKRMLQMRQLVAKFNVTHWVKIFMEKLKEVKQLQRSMFTRHVSAATAQSIINRYAKTRKRILFLDYDGTLVNFNSNLQQAPDKGLYELLGRLTEDTANRVVIISGRKHETLEEWFSDTNIYLIAEHGAWFKRQNTHWHKLPGLSAHWKQEIYPLLETYVDRTPGSFIEEKSYSLVWHYRNAQKGLGELRAGELVNNLGLMVNDLGLQLLPGDKVVEIKNVEINKGKSALTLIEDNNYDFIMALGDDHTDEDIFKALPDSAVTIKVGGNISAAKFFLKDPAEVRALLKNMTESTEIKTSD